MYAESTSRILDCIVEPVVRRLNPEAARALLEVHADSGAVARMEELAQKCNEGELLPEERAEYETNVFAGEFLALLQAQARALLAKRNGA
jgi:hypothetical protein